MKTLGPNSEQATRELNKAAQALSDQGHAYDFFQAISLLEKLDCNDTPHQFDDDRVRFVTSPDLSFPASSIQRIDLPQQPSERATVTVNFMGLTGPSGVLPRHYTEKVMEVERDADAKTRSTLRGWFDMFTSRFIWSMYRAWKKMRIDRSLPESQGPKSTPSPFAQGLFSLIGFGLGSLRSRLQVRTNNTSHSPEDAATEDRIRDWALLRHSSTLARRRRSAAQISRVLSDYFQVPVLVEQFQGQWLELDTDCQTRLGDASASSQLGVSAVVGRRVWDIESKLRLRVGPLTAEQFDSLLPYHSTDKARRRFIMLCQMARLLLGPEYDFDVQLVLDPQSVPMLKLSGSEDTEPSRLGWNTWLAQREATHDLDDAVFNSIESTTLDAPSVGQRTA